jgi:hypothetical protein
MSKQCLNSIQHTAYSIQLRYMCVWTMDYALCTMTASAASLLRLQSTSVPTTYYLLPLLPLLSTPYCLLQLYPSNWELGVHPLVQYQHHCVVLGDSATELSLEQSMCTYGLCDVALESPLRYELCRG